MVFQKKGGAATKRNFPQVNEKVPKKRFEAEEEEDDDDDEDMEDDSDFDDSDSDDASDSGPGGKMNIKGKQTPTQGKGLSLMKTPKGQPQTPMFLSGKKNQLPSSQQKQQMNKKGTPGVKSPWQGKIVSKQAVEQDDDDSEDDDEDDDDEDDDSDDAGGKMNAKGKQTPTQGKKGSSLTTPKDLAKLLPPPLSSGKKNQLATTPLQKQGKQNTMKEFPGIKGSGKGKSKPEPEEEDDDDDDDDDESEDDEDDSDDDEEVNAKMPQALNAKKTPNGKKDMHVSFELPKKGAAAKMQQNMPAQAKKNQPGKPANQNVAKGSPGKGALKGKKNTGQGDIDDDDDLSDDEEDDDEEDEEEEEDIDEEDDDDDDDDVDSDEQAAIQKKVASLKKEMLPKKDKKSLNEATTNSQEPKIKKAKNQQSPDAKPSKAFQETLEKELQRKRERDVRNLFIRNLPADVTVDEIKALSPDILDVKLPKPHKKNAKNVFGFLEFANEKKAEENYVKLQKKKLRGQEIFIDYSGEKSKNKNITNTINQKNINRTKLFITGLPVDVTMAEVAQLVPQCYAITLNNAPEFRNCSANFHTEEDAAKAFQANEKAKIRGRAITVLYGIDNKHHRSPQKRKRPSFQQQSERNPNFHSNKKFKQDRM